LFVIGVEQRVGLEPPAEPRRAAGGRDGRACLFCRGESQLDLTFE
jgi:hypothetical protein